MSGRDRYGTKVEETEPACPYCASKDLKIRRRDAIYLGTRKTGRSVTGYKVFGECNTCHSTIETRTAYHNKH